MSRKLSRGLVALTATLHAAMALAAVPPSERAKTEGFVVVRVAYNGGTSYDKIVVERADGDRRNAYLSGKKDGVETPATYAGWFEPGTYRFLLMEATLHNFVTTRETLNLEVFELPTFTVAAGELVDLGTWLQQPIGNGVAIALLNDARAFGEGRHNRELDDAALAFPGPSTRWDGSERWRRGASPSELLEASQRVTVVMKPPQFDAAGTAYFASTLGQVLRRTARGEWRNLDTGTLDTLSSILVDGSNIHASTEQHRLLQSLDGGATWTSAEVPVAASVTGIARLPNGDFVAATEAMPRSDAQVLRGPDFLALPSTPWATLKSGSTSRSEVRRTAVVGPVLDRLIVWTQPSSLHVFDIGDDRWTSSRAKRDLAELSANAAAGLVYSAAPLRIKIPSTGWRLLEGLISADGGTTWESVELVGHNGYGFRDRQNGIAMVVEGLLDRRTAIKTTSDGGETWNAVETPVPGYCMTAQYLPPTDELVCVTARGVIQSTRTGQDWTLERRGFD